VLAFIAYLIMAGVLLGVLKLGDAAVSFQVALAIVIYGSLPWMIHALLGVLSMLVGVDKEAFSIRNPAGNKSGIFHGPARQ
jgi:hypothetical protein